MFFAKFTPIAQVHHKSAQDSLHCPICKQALENELQEIQPCEHLAIVFDQESQNVEFANQEFNQRLDQQDLEVEEMNGFVLAQLGYKDQLLAMEQTRQGSWNRQFVAYNLH